MLVRQHGDWPGAGACGVRRALFENLIDVGRAYPCLPQNATSAAPGFQIATVARSGQSWDKRSCWLFVDEALYEQSIGNGA